MTDWVDVSKRQLQELYGTVWELDGWPLSFGEVAGGGEASVCEMSGESGETVAYLRFIQPHRTSPARIHRTEWLIGQHVLQESELFRGLPHAWVTTQQYGRPSGCDFDFIATFHDAVPGQTWRSVKWAFHGRVDAVHGLPTPINRVRAAKNLVATLAAFEEIGTKGFVHGDLTDRNLILDARTGKVNLIDFDAFVYQTSPTLDDPRISIGDGGVTGMSGYCPKDLEECLDEHAFAYSDRRARDMLLLELLAFSENDPPADAPGSWQQRNTTLTSVKPLAEQLGLPHLLDTSVFDCPESDRPTSCQLARALGLAIPKIAEPHANVADPLQDRPVAMPNFETNQYPDGSVSEPILPREKRKKRSRSNASPRQPQPDPWEYISSFARENGPAVVQHLPAFAGRFALCFMPLLFAYHFLFVGFLLAFQPMEPVYESLHHGPLNAMLYATTIIASLVASARLMTSDSQFQRFTSDPILSSVLLGAKGGAIVMHLFLFAATLFAFVLVAAVRLFHDGDAVPSTVPEAIGWPLSLVLLISTFLGTARFVKWWLWR
tara:strand:- start:26700 stop:28343 length:1644 start_codon:yes stop_codon:yes gene_type:complete